MKRAAAAAAATASSAVSGVDIHFQALCNAVENEKIEKVGSILDHNPDLDVARRNADDFTPLDLAFMLSNLEMLAVLMDHHDRWRTRRAAAAELCVADQDAFASPEAVTQRLTGLINESKKQVEKFGQLVKVASTSESLDGGAEGSSVAVPARPTSHAPPNLSAGQIKECEKQQGLWGKRLNGLRKMRAGFASNFVPAAPEAVQVTVLGTLAVQVGVANPDPRDRRSDRLATKIKVQWSESESFSTLVGQTVYLCNGSGDQVVCDISGLNGDGFGKGPSTPQRFLYFRAAFGNLKGFGPFQAAASNPVIMSSWRTAVSSDELTRTSHVQDRLHAEAAADVARAIFFNLLVDDSGAASQGLSAPGTGNGPLASGGLSGSLFGGGVSSTSSLSGMVSSGSGGSGGAGVVIKIPKKKGIFLQLLQAAGMPKFQRTLLPNRLYLCCVFYNEDKVLTTNEEALPLLLIDDLSSTFDINIHSEFHWFSKLCYIWDDAERLKKRMASIVNGPSSHSSKHELRSKLLNALVAMQDLVSGLGGDLGTAFRNPILLRQVDAAVDLVGDAVVFSLVRRVQCPKSAVSLSLKWAPMTRAALRAAGAASSISLSSSGGSSRPSLVSSADAANPSSANRAENLCLTIREQILYNQVNGITLDPGLYVCYVQTFTTIDGVLSVVVPSTSPTILPYCKIRDVSHVTSEEWGWLLNFARPSRGDDDGGDDDDSEGSESGGGILLSRSRMPSSKRIGVQIQVSTPTTNFLCGEGEDGSELGRGAASAGQTAAGCSEAQLTFAKSVAAGVDQLFNYLEVPEDKRGSHRVYSREVIEVSADVSLILVLPPAEAVCVIESAVSSVPLGFSVEDRNDLLKLPLHTFELIHVGAYNPDLITIFCRATVFLEMLVSALKQTQREALTDSEVEEATVKVDELLELQRRLDDVWRPLRWLWDVVCAGRERESDLVGVSLEQVGGWLENNANASLCKSDRLGTAAGGGVAASYVAVDPGRTSGRQEDASGRRGGRGGRYEGLKVAAMLQELQESAVSKSSLPASLASSPMPSPRLNLSNCGNNNNNNNNDSVVVPVRRTHRIYSDCGRQSPVVAVASSGPPFYRESPVETRSDIHHAYSAARDLSDHPDDGRQAFLGPSTASDRGATTPVSSGILQVYAAYHTGLASGTSVVISLTEATTSREVVDLVVRQLNLAVMIKGKEGPVYDGDSLKNFCLVAVIGNRERCLRDDFRPLHLQNPWKSGKLFVRVKSDVLAAIERHNGSGSSSTSAAAGSNNHLYGTAAI